MAKHRRRPGNPRHRHGMPRLVHCQEFAQVRARLEATRGPWYVAFRIRGRHTVAALIRSGARPRPAFALILSL
jgi:hypothetical protein